MHQSSTINRNGKTTKPRTIEAIQHEQRDESVSPGDVNNVENNGMVARGTQVVFELNHNNVNTDDESDVEPPQVSIQSTCVIGNQSQESHLSMVEFPQITVLEQMQSNMKNFQGQIQTEVSHGQHAKSDANTNEVCHGSHAKSDANTALYLSSTANSVM